MVKKASKRLWILRRLKQLRASTHDLVDVYIKQIRCILELVAPAWLGGISQAEKLDLERVQKCAAHIILGNVYTSYSNALEILNLDSSHDLPVEGLLEGSGDTGHCGATAQTCLHRYPRGSQGAPHLDRQHRN